MLMFKNTQNIWTLKERDLFTYELLLARSSFLRHTSESAGMVVGVTVMFEACIKNK